MYELKASICESCTSGGGGSSDSWLLLYCNSTISREKEWDCMWTHKHLLWPLVNLRSHRDSFFKWSTSLKISKDLYTHDAKHMISPRLRDVSLIISVLLNTILSWGPARNVTRILDSRFIVMYWPFLILELPYKTSLIILMNGHTRTFLTSSNNNCEGFEPNNNINKHNGKWLQ